jgi:asparagine synthase (glutamine-hydrolysing)
MCGIAGILKFEDSLVDDQELKKMTNVIFYRGPDGEGQWINSKKNIGLGHRRLSIIDLSDHAKQPMHYAGNRYSITFNGEIYNYIELKEELVKAGYTFQSNSDTEVLLALYDQKKEKCLDGLDGMFSFAIWDEQEQELFCARDRFGEKPFHYYLDSRQFVFGSEIKQLWAYGIPKKSSEQRINNYIAYGIVDDANDMTSTFYENIKRLDAAHYLRIKANGEIQISQYWSIDLNAEKYKGSIEQASEEFIHLLTESIHLRLRSDVPVGSSLSGGLDSSSIVMLIDQLKGNGLKQNTFSARFKDFAKDEGKHIEEVVKACKNVEVHYTWPDEHYFMEVLDKVNYHQDEPYGSASIVAQYAVMELAKKNNVTVLLDGQGADEYLGGYLPYYKLYLNQLFFNDHSNYKKELPAYNSFHGNTYPYVSLEKQETFRMKLGRYKRKVLNQDMPYSSNTLSERLRNDIAIVGIKELLRYADRNSMAHSREVRLPFLSHKLVEFAFSLPDAYKLNLGWTKYVLRKAMNTTLPKSICWRVDKIGYEPPQTKWLGSPQIKEEIKKAQQQFSDIYTGPKLSDNFQADSWRLLIAYKYK